MARSFLPPEGPAAVCRFALSADGAWLASLDAHRRLRLYNLDAMQHHATLPMLDAVPTALEFDPGCSVLVVALALLSSTAGEQLAVMGETPGDHSAFKFAAPELRADRQLVYDLLSSQHLGA